MALNDINGTTVQDHSFFPFSLFFARQQRKIHTRTLMLYLLVLLAPIFSLLSTTDTLFHACVLRHSTLSTAQHGTA